MARVKRQVLKAKKEKKKFTGRATTVAQIKLGGEPKLMFPNKMALINALNWYTQCVEREHRIGFLVSYMEANNFDKNAIHVISSKGKNFPNTWAYISRLLMNGSCLSDEEEVRANLKVQIDAFVERHSGSEVELDDDGNPIFSTTKTPSVAPISKAVVAATPIVNALEEIWEGILEGKPAPDMTPFEWLTRQGCDASTAKLIRAHFQNSAQEMYDLAGGRDEQLNEAYAEVRTKWRKAAATFLLTLLQDCDQFAEVKKVRRERKKKPVTADRQVRRVKFLKESTEYKVTSQLPIKVIGATQIILFNAARRSLSIYTADEKGFGVHGNALLNVATARAKKLRKPLEVLPDFLKGTSAGAVRSFEKLTTTEHEATGRFGADIMILRVW